MADLSLDGLATGMGTESMINQILQAEYGTKINNLSQDKSDLEVEKGAWRDVNSRLSTLESKLTGLKLSSTFTSKTTSSSSEDIATATANTDAQEGTYSVEVVDTALAHRVAGTQNTTKSADSANVESINDISMTNGGEYTVSSISQTINNFAGSGTSKTFNYALKNSDGNVVALSETGQVYTALSEKTTESDLTSLTSSEDTGENYGFGSTVTSGKVRMEGTDSTGVNTLTTAIMMKNDTATINGVNISVAATDTLEDFVDNINDSDAGVTATIVSDRLVLESNNTGTDNTMTLADTSDLFADLGLTQTDDTIITTNAGYQGARNAEININGITGITSQSNTFDNAVSNMNFKIDSSASTGDTTTISVSKDTEKATSAIQAFVDQYNSVQDFIGTKLNYDAETEDAGALQGDGTLMRLESNLRTYLTDTVSSGNNHDQLSVIGIEVDQDGVMSFNSSKFENALDDNPEAVKDLFNADTEDGDSFDGVATKLDSYVDSLIKSNVGVIPEKIDSYKTLVTNVEDEIESVQDRMESQEEVLKKEFTAMEKAISEMNSQMSWLQSQISSMGLGSSMTGMM